MRIKIRCDEESWKIFGFWMEVKRPRSEERLPNWPALWIRDSLSRVGVSAKKSPRFSMASPPCLLFRPSPPLCSRRRRSRPPSPYLLSKQSLHRLPSPRTCRRPVVAAVAKQLVPRPPGTGRRTGATGFACHCSYDTKNGLPTPPPDKVRELWKCCCGHSSEFSVVSREQLRCLAMMLFW
jgi:hypothetical protein